VARARALGRRRARRRVRAAAAQRVRSVSGKAASAASLPVGGVPRAGGARGVLPRVEDAAAAVRVIVALALPVPAPPPTSSSARNILLAALHAFHGARRWRNDDGGGQGLLTRSPVTTPSLYREGVFMSVASTCHLGGIISAAY
jgi:hypothetical protein